MISSHIVKMSTVHALGMEIPQDVPFHWHMPEGLKLLSNRLKTTREALGISPADLCRRIDIAENRWSQYENGKRRITIEVVSKLCDEFGLSLDWIYRADPAHLPHQLRLKIRQAA